MKANKIFKTVLIFLMTTVVLISCESHEKKADDYIQSKNSLKVSKDETNDNKDKGLNTVKKSGVKKEETSEWLQFKLLTEKKIASNESKIKKIKSNPLTTQKMVRQLAELEEANNDLKIQLALFNEEVIAKWENFKTSMNHDVNEIEIELRDLSTK